MTRQRKKFTRREKLEVVRQIEHGEKKLSEVGRELGVASSTVSAWRQEWQELGSKAFPGKGQGNSKDEELARLRRENASLMADNEIPKKRSSVPRNRCSVRYAFIERQRKQHSVARLCRCLGGSRSGYYWKKVSGLFSSAPPEQKRCQVHFPRRPRMREKGVRCNVEMECQTCLRPHLGASEE